MDIILLFFYINFIHFFFVAKNRLYMSSTGTLAEIVKLLSTPFLNLKEAALLCIWGYGETGTIEFILKSKSVQ